MKFLYLIAILLTLLEVQAQVIPADRRVNWELENQHFQFVQPDAGLSILDFGGSNDGITDNSAAVGLAMEQTEGSAATLFFPPGSYLFNAPVMLQDSIVLKGAGSELTTLLFNFNQQDENAINITGSAQGSKILLDGGFTKNSSKVFTDSAFLFSAGEMVEITEANGDWDVVPISWAVNSVGQMTVIDSVVGDTLYLQSPLRITYDTVLHPSIKKVNPIVNVGISCLTIKRLDEPVDGSSYNINIAYARNCQVSGIESDTSNGSHVYIAKSLTVNITGSYFHHAFQYDGGGTRGYGVTVAHHSSECSIENNIFSHLRHAMMVKTGANGNIIGYNYSRDPYRGEPIHDLSGDISLHGHFAYANLFESNIVQNIIIDHYWGPSGPFNTLFRNRAERWGIIMTTNDVLETSNQNFVGNETTDFNLFYGQYVLTGNDHFQYGNNILNVTLPSGTGDLGDSSYYLKTKPSYWDVNDLWPSIGYPNILDSGTIPAKARFDAGFPLTVCEDSVFTAVQTKPRFFSFQINPNPNKGHFSVTVDESIPENSMLSIFNSWGVSVYQKPIRTRINSAIPISLDLSSGFYLVVLQNGSTVSAKKMIVYE